MGSVKSLDSEAGAGASSDSARTIRPGGGTSVMSSAASVVGPGTDLNHFLGGVPAESLVPPSCSRSTLTETVDVDTGSGQVVSEGVVAAAVVRSVFKRVV